MAAAAGTKHGQEKLLSTSANTRDFVIFLPFSSPYGSRTRDEATVVEKKKISLESWEQVGKESVLGNEITERDNGDGKPDLRLSSTQPFGLSFRHNAKATTSE